MLKSRGIMLFSLIIIAITFDCSGPVSDQPVLNAEVPLHLEEHLDDARIEGSEVPENLPIPVEWRFDEAQPDWKPAIPMNKTTKPVRVVRIEDALRVILNESNFNPSGRPVGGISIDLPGWHRGHWAYIQVRSRASEKIRDFRVGFNPQEKPETPPSDPWPFHAGSEVIPVISDGSVQNYLIRTDFDSTSKIALAEQWQQLGIWFRGAGPASIDILSISVIPKEASYSGSPTGICTEVRNSTFYRSLYTHTPVQLKYKVQVPKAGRLDVGLGVVRDDVPITFKITAKTKIGEALGLHEEIYANQKSWAQRSIDLSQMSGQDVILTLEADSEQAGTVALWGAPTISGKRSSKKPNIIFYIIDGAGADHMSVYGYNRRTTPNLERLASEGAIFEHAFSNSTWTKVSNPSFMTSLHNSVLGGYKSDSDPLPDQAVTMALHLHRAGYQTGVFVSNSYAGIASGLERGVDILREDIFEQHSVSSKELASHFWKWRKAHPGEPYWVHFQTTDIHGPQWKPAAPFAGLFISPEQRQTFSEWQLQMKEAGDRWGYPYSEVWAKTGISPIEFSYILRGLYDELMAHNDHQIGQLVKRLKAIGEWKNTLFIVAADHGYAHAGISPLDPLPPKWFAELPIFASFYSRIPMIFVWPGKIAPDRRFSHPVSMIDMLPTILDLANLPLPEIMQGQSLAPLLLGEKDWKPKPVIFDEFEINRETGELIGNIEVVDEQWGASLRIGSDKENRDGPPEWRRPAPLLLYDIWNDPYCLHSLHEERTDLVEKYTKFLKEQWKTHRELAKHFSRSSDVPLTPEQLRILRSLGYVK